MSWQLRVVAVVSALIVTACSDLSTRDLPPPMQLSTPPLVLTRVLRERVEREKGPLVDADTFSLFHPLDLSLAGSRLLVVDSGNDRLVVFDTLFAPLYTIGSEGAGPGELQDPFFAVAKDDRYWVVDMGNHRLSVYGLGGVFLESFRLPGRVGPVAIDKGVGVVIGSRFDGHYMVVLDSSGKFRALGNELRLGADSTARQGTFSGVFGLVAVAGGAVHYFDNERGILLKFDRAGDLVLARSLPEHVLAEIEKRQRAEREAFARMGVRLLGSPVARSLKTTERGELLLMLAHDDPAGLVIDPRDYRARPLEAPSEGEDWDALRNAYAAILRDNTLYALHSAGLTAYGIAERS